MGLVPYHVILQAFKLESFFHETVHRTRVIGLSYYILAMISSPTYMFSDDAVRLFIVQIPVVIQDPVFKVISEDP